MESNKLAAIVLAAGLGKRMKSNLAKVLHKIGDKTMIEHVMQTLSTLPIDQCVVVVGHQGIDVSNLLGHGIKVAWQKELLGTGHATYQAKELLADKSETAHQTFIGNVLVLCGDTPLIKKETIERLIKTHLENSADATILTVMVENPVGYGRIIKDERSGQVLRIVEEADATIEEKDIKFVNTGTYCFKSPLLFDILENVSAENAQGEYYLTDVIEILRKNDYKILTIETDDPIEVMGINSQKELAIAEERYFQIKGVFDYGYRK